MERVPKQQRSGSKHGLKIILDRLVEPRMVLKKVVCILRRGFEESIVIRGDRHCGLPQSLQALG